MGERVVVGGVPEHFLVPVMRAAALLEARFEFQPVPEGTGAMIAKLKEGSLDVAMALTEGVVADIAQGSDLRILGTYVKSPLRWAASVAGARKDIGSLEDLKDKKFGISRFKSGSHLMACVLALQYGWDPSALQFEVKGNFKNLRDSLNDGTSDVFLWENLMCKPFHDSGEIKKVGEILTPWPCFVIVSTKQILEKKGHLIRDVILRIQTSVASFYGDMETSIEEISRTFHLDTDSCRAWMEHNKVVASWNVTGETISKTLVTLQQASVLRAELSWNIKDFLAEGFATLSESLESMNTALEETKHDF